jgi:transglutaminase-like putative cysteine protease
VEHFELQVEPHPTGSSDNLDIDSNSTTTIWFNDMHDSLAIQASSVVYVPRIDPFDFIITEEKILRLPTTYPANYSEVLEPYVRRRYQSTLLDDFVRPILTRSKDVTTSFLSNLSMEIFDQFSRESRKSGDPLHPDDTLTRRSGACRDLALLFMECCRSVGLAARFVSGYGYIENATSLEKRHMHAWAEVYLPGGGWKGFDPSIGLAISGEHVAVAIAADPKEASPTSGKFRGNNAQSTLTYEVRIQYSD